MEINELLESNKKSQDALENINNDLKKQVSNYKENEKRYKERMLAIELELERTKTEDFIQLKEDNKKLIQENFSLRTKCEELEGEVRTLTNSFEEMSKEAEALRDSLIKELDNTKSLLIQLENEKQILEVEKYSYSKI